MEETKSPRIFRIDSKESKEEFNRFLEDHPETEILDTLYVQLADYIRSRHPSRELAPLELEIYMEEILGSRLLSEYGCWVYYPWSRRLVHLLDETEFASLRTDRNKNKITAAEQAILRTKKIGLIGLSVGHSVATTLALERGFGELRIADYDVLDLSNLNRIRSGVQNIGVSKTTIVSREISELDPYLNVRCYDEGITDDNLFDFLTADGGIDLLIDECDSIEVKLKCREMARELGIPVIMETSDRGMMDVERFDLDPNRPILHGRTKGVGSIQLKDMSQKEAFDLILGIVDVDNCSTRMKQSLPEIKKTISTWPQLGSDVVHGGAAVARLARNILLKEPVESGRFYSQTNQTTTINTRQHE
jgi:molybdopterin/thiamine biosynthesis adenylyltransferase